MNRRQLNDDDGMVYVTLEVSEIGIAAAKDGDVIVGIGKSKRVDDRIAEHNTGKKMGRLIKIGSLLILPGMTYQEAETFYHDKYRSVRIPGRREVYRLNKEWREVMEVDGIVFPSISEYDNFNSNTTPRYMYRKPVLQALYILGRFPGDKTYCAVQTVVRIVCDIMKDILKPEDFDVVDTESSQETHAEKHIHWVRWDYVQAGLICDITNGSEMGDWVLTKEGLIEAKKLTNGLPTSELLVNVSKNRSNRTIELGPFG